MHKNFIPGCVESYLDPVAKTSVETLVRAVHPDAKICSGAAPVFPPIPTPYLSETDMFEINKGYSQAQAPVSGNWQVSVLIQCDITVYDPQKGGYFIPFSSRYLFETMPPNQYDGQDQLARIGVSEGRPVLAGDMIGTLKQFKGETHLEFGTTQYASSDFSIVSEIPFCPEPQFTSAARASLIKLLNTAWPHGHLCYQR